MTAPVSPSAAIGEAVVDHLRASAALRTALGAAVGDSRIYRAGDVPESPARPYVVVGNTDGAPGGVAAVMGAHASRDVQEVRSWGDTDADARTVGVAVEAAILAPAPIMLDGFALLRARILSRRTVPDPPGTPNPATQYLIRVQFDTRPENPGP